MIGALQTRQVRAVAAPRNLETIDLTEVGAVILCATDPRQWEAVDLGQISFFQRQSELHLVYPSIVGCDLMPWPYYQAKTLCEKALAEGPNPWSILRATQFHQLIWAWYATPSPRLPWLLVPSQTRYQVLDPSVVAEALVESAVSKSTGRLPDLGGPHAYEAAELARSVQRALRRKRLVIAYNKPGLFGAALRAGANLTPNRGGGETWNQFLARRLAL